jgi:hypothetical protein
MDDLAVAIDRRSSRGAPRGATDVLDGARRRATQQRRRRRGAVAAACAVAALAVGAGLVARDGGDDSRVIAGPGQTVGSGAQGPLLVRYGAGTFDVVEADTGSVVFRTEAADAGCPTCAMVQISRRRLVTRKRPAPHCPRRRLLYEIIRIESYGSNERRKPTLGGIQLCEQHLVGRPSRRDRFPHRHTLRTPRHHDL